MAGMSLLMRSVVPVWVLTILAVISVGLFVAPADYLVYLPVVLGLALLVSFAAQLIEPVRTGLVNRFSATLGGVFVILALSTIVLGPLAFAAGAKL